MFFEFVTAAEQMYPNNRNISVLDMEVEQVTDTYPRFWKWADQRLDDTLGKNTA